MGLKDLCKVVKKLWVQKSSERTQLASVRHVCLEGSDHGAEACGIRPPRLPQGAIQGGFQT